MVSRLLGLVNTDDPCLFRLDQAWDFGLMTGLANKFSETFGPKKRWGSKSP